MIEKPILSPEFSVEDIRKLRTYTAEVMKNMTTEEIIAYIEEGAKGIRQEIAEGKIKNAIKQNKISTSEDIPLVKTYYNKTILRSEIMVKIISICVVALLLLVGCVSTPKTNGEDMMSKWISVEYFEDDEISMSTTLSLNSLVGDGAIIELMQPDGVDQKMIVKFTDDLEKISVDYYEDGEIFMSTTITLSKLEGDGAVIEVLQPDGMDQKMIVKYIDDPTTTATNSQASLTIKGENVRYLGDIPDVRELVITADKSLLEQIVSDDIKVYFVTTSSESSILDEKKVSISTNEVPLHEVFNDLADQSGLNIVISGKTDDEVYQQKITMQYSDISIKTAFDVLTQITGLSYRFLGDAAGFLVGPIERLE